MRKFSAQNRVIPGELTSGLRDAPQDATFVSDGVAPEVPASLEVGCASGTVFVEWTETSVSQQSVTVTDISGESEDWDEYRYHTLSIDASGTLVVDSSPIGEFDASDPDAEPVTQVVEPDHPDGNVFIGTAIQFESGIDRVFDGRYILDEWPQQTLDTFDTVEVFEADGTFDASGVTLAWVEVVGGGGSGGSWIDSSSSVNAVLGSGAGGGYAAGYVDLQGTDSVAVTVGAGGTAPTSGSSTEAGNAGNTSSFGSDIEASGGDGADGFVDVATGGTGVSGPIAIDGQNGVRRFVDTDIIIRGSEGGDSVLGSGGASNGPEGDETSFGFGGIDGSGYGGGGSGAIAQSPDAGNDYIGGDGADGVVIVHY